jgi:superfamily II DNA or RNA helicase
MAGCYLYYASGTVEIRGLPSDCTTLPASYRWDERTCCFRAPAAQYAEAVLALRAAQVPYQDEARLYQELPQGALVRRQPRPYQKKALEAWENARGRGVVVLPTGSGKTLVGLLAIERKKRSTLVIAPTLVLVQQWYDALRSTFAMPVGVMGGGEYRLEPLTVTTYDSAYLHMDHLGARFGLLIFDECHHLPSATYALAARFSIAPFRLGLTATPERADGRDADLLELIGPTVYRREIVDLSGDYLAEYETERITVELAPDERTEYEHERGIYLGFLRTNQIQMSDPRGWSTFIFRSSITVQGRRAMQAYRRQRELAFAAPAKLDYLAHLVHLHRHDRTLVFTQDNDTAYNISRKFLIPAITHQTKVSERSDILERFQQGIYHAVVTSKVLNEGVDVPCANVAIVVSGSGSTSEHVQRLGRILRKQGDKRAILYELVTAGTSETHISKRRREHVAYR